LSGTITWKILQPYWEPEDDKQREAKRKAEALMESIKKRNIERASENADKEGK